MQIRKILLQSGIFLLGETGMIKLAGIGIAMGNAPEDVKSAADYTVGDNDSDGVAEALEKFVL
ncbi:MAG: hypothetical protein FJW66_07155 [Actinobacteria bacterium]|nr:hypothetical protein [Actinomycetota bacterium]